MAVGRDLREANSVYLAKLRLAPTTLFDGYCEQDRGVLLLYFNLTTYKFTHLAIVSTLQGT